MTEIKYDTEEVDEQSADGGCDLLELFSSKPQFVNLEVNGKKRRMRYCDVFSKKLVSFKDRDLLVQWTPTKFNPSAHDDEVKSLISGIEWDRNEFHDNTSEIEKDLLFKVVDVIKSVYAQGKRLSDEWWANLNKGFQLVAALRDYHDYRMGLTKTIYKKYSKIFVSGGYSPNSLRDYKHFFRIWNCIIFPYELREFLEGPLTVGSDGTRIIPRSVVHLLLEGKSMPFFMGEKLEEILLIVDKYRQGARSIRSRSVDHADHADTPVSCL